MRHHLAVVSRELKSVVAFVLTLLAAGISSAQEGTIEGRVYNEATGRYLAGAQVEVEGNRAVITDDRGNYSIEVRSGEVTMEVTYTGLDRVREIVTVPPGGRIQRDIGLTAEIYVLEELTVSGEREGRALALTQQRQAPNVKNVVAADTFGNVANGNPGDFLQMLPGITGEYVGADIRSIQVRGISGDLNSVSMDGSQLAASDSSGLGRKYEFEQASLGLIETIEVTKAPTPDMPANSLGGNVNMVTKSAFDRQDKRYFTYSIGGTHRPKYNKPAAHSWQEPFGEIGPSMNFAYADRFGESENIGLVLTATYHSQPNGESGHQLAFQNTADQPAYIYNTLVPRAGNTPRTRLALGGKVEYKISDQTILALNFADNWFHENNDHRRVTLRTGNNANNFAPGYTEERQMVLINNASNSRMQLFTDDISGQTIVISPSIRHRGDVWNIDAKYSFSHAQKWWEYYPYNNRKFGSVANATIDLRMNGGIGYTIDRTDVLKPRISMTEGSRDFYNLGNYYDFVRVTFSDKTLDDVVNAFNLDLEREFEWVVPTQLKFGGLFQTQDRDFDRNDRRFDHIGLDGQTGTPDDSPGAFLDKSGAFGNLRDDHKPWPLADPYLLAQNVIDDPGMWNEDVAYNENQRLLNDKTITETIKAAYVSANLDFSRFSVLAGLRFERTETDGEGPVTVAGQPTGRMRSQGSYDDVFPGLHLKYDISENLLLRASYSTSIGRPSFASLIPSNTVDDTAQTVRSSNASLRPQYSDNYDLSLEYYFEPAGMLSFGLFQKDVTDFQYVDSSVFIGDGQDNGFNGMYEGYQLITERNGGSAKYKGLELAYYQQFSFLPGFWKGLGFYASYTKLETEGDYGGASATSEVAGFLPESASASLSYNYGAFDFKVNGTYRGEYLISVSSLAHRVIYQKPRTQIDIKMRYNFSEKFGVFMDVENINNAPIAERYQGYADRVYFYRVGSPKYILGVQGRF